MRDKKPISEVGKDAGHVQQVSCPVCGYRMPVFFSSSAECRGLYVTCKGRGCKNRFEITVKNGEQTK